MRKGKGTVALALVVALVVGLAGAAYAADAPRAVGDRDNVVISGPTAVKTGDLIDITISMNEVRGAAAKLVKNGLEIEGMTAGGLSQMDAIILTSMSDSVTYNCRVTAQAGETCSLTLDELAVSDGQQDIPMESMSWSCVVTPEDDDGVDWDWHSSTEGSLEARLYENGILEVIVKGFPDAESVQLPTWTRELEQDDIVWYNTEKQEDGSWRGLLDTGKHGGGRMYTHVYADTELIADIRYDAPASSQTYATAENTEGSLYRVALYNVPADAESASFATWSLANGQDDLVWYPAEKKSDGVWEATIDSALHGEGWIVSHAYYNGDQLGGAVIFALPQAAPYGESTKISGTRYVVTVHNAGSNVEEVLVPTWSVPDEQDDIIWYKAEKQDDGTWTATVDLADHPGTPVVSHIYADNKHICSVGYAIAE